MNDTDKDLHNEEATAVGVLASQMEEFQGAKLHEIAGPNGAKATFMVLPRGKSIIDLKKLVDKARVTPERRVGTTRLGDAESFIRMVNRFKGVESVVFVDPDQGSAEPKPVLTAIFDYHPEGAAVVGESETPQARWLEHRATYVPELSDAWRRWFAHDEKWMAQGQFAEHIEDRILDVIVPYYDDPNLKSFAELLGAKYAGPSEMLTLARGMTVNVSAAVKNAVNIADGTISVVYEDAHKDGEGKPLDVPGLFQICIPVFYNGAKYRLPVRLRYRVKDRMISWSYSIANPEIVFDHAIRELAQDVETKTSAQVFIGKADAPARTENSVVVPDAGVRR